jgi:hypothetical protein
MEHLSEVLDYLITKCVNLEELVLDCYMDNIIKSHLTVHSTRLKSISIDNLSEYRKFYVDLVGKSRDTLETLKVKNSYFVPFSELEGSNVLKHLEISACRALTD